MWKGSEALSTSAWSRVCFLKTASTNPSPPCQTQGHLGEAVSGPTCNVFVILTHPHPCFSRPRACAHGRGCANRTGDQKRRNLASSTRHSNIAQRSPSGFLYCRVGKTSLEQAHTPADAHPSTHRTTCRKHY